MCSENFAAPEYGGASGPDFFRIIVKKSCQGCQCAAISAAFFNLVREHFRTAFALRNSGMNFEDYKKVVGYDKWESVDERFAPRT